MPRAQVGTPKYLANAMKSKGLQRLRWYCQVCEKQCRDENGFKCHSQSEAHLRQMLVVGENAGTHISNYSSEFQHEFVQLLSRRFNTTRVHANRVYQELIQDKHHMHMNATRWVTLTEFVKHLGRCGIARVDETEKGWFIAWVDNTPKALAKQEASMKKERATVSDEQRERLLIQEQISRAAAEKGREVDEEQRPAVEEGLKRDEGEKLVLSFSMKPAAAATRSTSPPDAATPESSSSTTVAAASPAPSTASTSTVTTSIVAPKFNALKPKPATLAAGNPLKRPNVFKMAAAKSNGTDKAKDGKDGGRTAGRKREAEMTAAERLILEDQDRKRRRMEREAVRS